VEPPLRPQFHERRAYGDAAEPRRQSSAFVVAPQRFGQSDEHVLEHVFGVCLRARDPVCSGIHDARVALEQRAAIKPVSSVTRPGTGRADRSGRAAAEIAVSIHASVASPSNCRPRAGYCIPVVIPSDARNAQIRASDEAKLDVVI
jgi:hypothetical protein